MSVFSLNLQELFLQNTEELETTEGMKHEEFVSYVPPIYVVSKVSKLADYITKFAPPVVHREVVVFTVSIPEDSNVLDDDSCSDLANAKVVVIDPVLLCANYKKLSALEWAHCTWAGVEGLFTSMKVKPEFLITKHGGDDFANLIAEYVLSHVLNWERGFKMLCLAQKQKYWSSLTPESRTLDEITISVLGVGNMAQAIARYFKPHGTKVIAMARTLKKEHFFHLFDRVSLSLDEVLSSCDYLVNVLPHTSLTTGMLNGEILKGCVKRPVFINIGRGSIIDEANLIHAIESNWISGAVLDVFNEEPLPPSSPLWEMNQVIITPHCAAFSRADHIAQSFLKTLVKLKQGEPISNAVDWEAGY